MKSCRPMVAVWIRMSCNHLLSPRCPQWKSPLWSQAFACGCNLRQQNIWSTLSTFVLNKHRHDTVSQRWTNNMHLGICPWLSRQSRAKTRMPWCKIWLAMRAGLQQLHKAQAPPLTQCSDYSWSKLSWLSSSDYHVRFGQQGLPGKCRQTQLSLTIFCFNTTTTIPCLRSCCAMILPGYWSAWKGQVVLRIKTPWVAWWAKLTMFHKE